MNAAVRRRHRTLPVLLLALVSSTCMRASEPAAPVPAPLGLPDEAWVQNTLRSLSLEQRVGQLLMVRLPGGYDNARSAAMKDAQRLVGDYHIGGVLVERAGPLEIAAKLNRLQSAAGLPLLAAAETEWGAAAAIDGATVLPPAMAIAATHDTALADLAGRITATEARAVGIHLLLAPVVDVIGVPDNPSIGVRSYGADPATVTRYAAAFIRGATAAGALTVARHFPGQGASRVDPQYGLPVLHSTKAELLARELAPFRGAVAAGASAVQLGHIAAPSLTGGIAVPATLAPEIGTDLLRGALGFDGLVVTDVMDAGVVRETRAYSPGEVAVRAVEAGADVILAPPDPALAHRALVSAVRSGRMHYSRIDSSVVRVLRAKARLGLHRDRMVALDSLLDHVGAPEHGIVAADMAARSLTLARDSAPVLPLDPRRTRSIAVTAYSPVGAAPAAETLLDELVRIYGRAVTLTSIDAQSSLAVHDSAVARAGRADAAIIALFLPSSTAPAALLPIRPLAGRIASEAPRVAVVSFGEPFAAATLPGAATHLVAWQPAGSHAARAVARAIAGRVSVTGRLPVALPRGPAATTERSAVSYGLSLADAADVGMDDVALRRVDDIIHRAIAEGAAPGAAIAVGRHGRLVRLRGYGSLDRRRGLATPVSDSTLYDLASLTKVVATTTAVMMLIDDGLLRLDDPVARHIPEFGGDARRNRVTIRHLLEHSSGLPAYAPLWSQLQGREAYRRRIASMPLEFEPGSDTRYSDFGAILLGMIVEQVSGRPLDQLVRERLWNPLGMTETGFNPLRWPQGAIAIEGQGAAPDPLWQRIAPTENDTVFRRRHIRGEVHDENAFALGGVAGHAGLFSSARDLAIFAQMLLDRGWYGGRRYIDPATVELFTRRQRAGSSRALGWDTPEGATSAGSWFTAASFGHTGFTGTSIWIDPVRDVFVILLTNRVNPSRDNQRHIPLRRDVADAVQRAIIDMPVFPRGAPTDPFGW